MPLRKHTHSVVLLHLGFDLWRGIFLSLLSFPVHCSLHYCTGILWGKAEESFSVAVGHGSVPGLLWCWWLAPRALRGELLCLCACCRVCLEDPAVWFNAEQMAYLPLDATSYWSVSFPQFASWKKRMKQWCLRSNCSSILNALQSMVREVAQFTSYRL